MEIPKLNVEANYIPEAWEKMVIAIMTNGVDIKTEYDKPEDPPSKDATVSVNIHKPLAEPRLHLNIPGGPTDLEVYRQEVVEGIHDHWVDQDETSWTYTYALRLFNYSSSLAETYANHQNHVAKKVDQINFMVEKLVSSPYSRRAQAITWDQHRDPQSDDPPCLRTLWARLLPDDDGTFWLNVRLYWRSRDIWKAWVMNMWALTSLIEEKILVPLSEKLDGPVKMANLVDTMDSAHIYGSYMDDKFWNEIAKINPASPGSWEDRALDSTTWDSMFEHVRENLAKDPDRYKKGGDRW